jgi:3-hydroxyisobutyrate dehydrogenase
MSTHSNSRVGFLGTGLMGSAMGGRLLSQGIEVVAWDQDASHLQGLRERGAEVAGSEGEVPSRAAVVITMLPTAEIVRSVVEPLLSSWPQETVWLQMSSVGASEADELARLAAAHDVVQFDAPVSGSTHPAGEGKLTILASGPEDERSRVEPVLGVLGSRVQWVGGAGMGSRLKLAANHWMIAMVAALAETMHLCELMELEQKEFLALLDGGALGPPYGLEKLREMSRHDYPAGFPARLAVKDLELVREVADASGVTLPVLDTMLARMSAIADARGDDDLAVVYELPPSNRLDS